MKLTHRPRTPQIASSMRLAAWLFCLTCLALAAAAGLLGHAVQTITSRPAYLALGLLGLACVCALLQYHLARRVRCPLCLVPPLVPKGCSKSRHARRLLGSYRLRVACGVIFRSRFRCPYCGEHTRVTPRPNP